MMRLPKFSYHAPATVAEAARILAGEGPSASVVAGGTDLYPNMKRRHQTPRTLVGLRAIRELRGISGNPESGMRLGPCLSLTEVSQHPMVREGYPEVAAAVDLISTPILRNMGTLGGNICLDTRCNYYNQNYEWRRAINFCMKCDGTVCWVAPSSDTCLAVNSSDTVPLLCALGARVRLVSSEGDRELPVVDLFRRDGIRYLNRGPGEILTDVLLPARDGWSAAYRKLRRREAFDFPVLGVAAAVRLEPDGTVRDARIFLNAVASAPVEAVEASKVLIGKKLTVETIGAAAAKAALPAKPVDNTDFHLAWRKTMARVYTERTLADLMPKKP